MPYIKLQSFFAMVTVYFQILFKAYRAFELVKYDTGAYIYTYVRMWYFINHAHHSYIVISISIFMVE